MRNAIEKKSYFQAGYTLVEIAIVMLIIGIFMGTGLHLWGIYKMNQKSEATETTRIRITSNIDDFKNLYGRYPCPARYDAQRGDADYGYEGDCTDVSVTPGNCANGYCVEASQRTVTLDDASVITPRVRRGALPFRTLLMPEEESYDAYGGRFSYAVTEILTDWQSFDVRDGGISIVDNTSPVPNSVIDPPDSGLYFVFSHGKDNVGAYDINGNQISQCNGTMMDNENCNTSSLHRFAIYRSSTQSEVPVDTVNAGVVVPGTPPSVNINTHYDDHADFRSMKGSPIWQYSDATPDNIHDALQNQRIVIGSTNAEQKVNVDDITKLNPRDPAEPGNTQSNVLCARDTADGDCFEPELIGGTGMQCPPNTVARAIGSRGLTCVPIAVSCVGNPSGDFITGFNPDGSPRCSNVVRPVVCNSTNRTLCGVSRRLPPSGPTAPHNSSYTLTAGVSFSQTWQCNNGTWNRTSQSGVCNCTPGSTTTSSACGTGFTGTQTTTTTTVCPAGTTTTTTNRSACVCAAYNETGTRNCTAPWSGVQTRTRAYACVAGAPTPGPWSAWGPACTCPAQPPQTTAAACPTNYSGTATQTRTLNTTTCTWGAPVVDQSGCFCDNSRRETRTIGCTAPQTGTINQERALLCPSGNWGPWTDVTASCSCVDRYIYRAGPACPPGQTGAITERRLVTCTGANIPGNNWQQDTNTCVLPPQYYWKPFGTVTGSTRGNPRPKEDDSCTNPGGVTSCYVAVGAGTFDRYNCRCE